MRKVAMLVHGASGVGKTWFAHTTPGPRLILDAEGGSFDTLSPTVNWDMLNDPVPTDLTDDTSVVVQVDDMQMLKAALVLLRGGLHPFESVVIDSLTEIQKILKAQVQRPGEQYDPNGLFDQQAWGRLLNNMELMVRSYRDLTRPSTTRPVNVCVVSGSDTEAIPVRMLLQGSIRKGIAYYYDMVGYMFTAADADGQEVRVMQIADLKTADAKCRLHNVKVKYGTHIENPDFRELLAVVNEGVPTNA